MSSNQPRPGISGFAFIEALVALLLLAIAMLGAGAALVESLAGQRAALLQTQAADLAANLAEALRAAPDAATAAAEIQSWGNAALLLLPQAEPFASARNPDPPGSANLPARFDIRLQWRDARAPAPSQLSLALAFNAAAGAS